MSICFRSKIDSRKILIFLSFLLKQSNEPRTPNMSLTHISIRNIKFFSIQIYIWLDCWIHTRAFSKFHKNFCDWKAWIPHSTQHYVTAWREFHFISIHMKVFLYYHWIRIPQCAFTLRTHTEKGEFLKFMALKKRHQINPIESTSEASHTHTKKQIKTILEFQQMMQLILFI